MSVRHVVTGLALVLLVVAVACATGGRGGGGKADAARGQKYFMAKCNACHPNGGAGAGPTIVGKTPPGPLVKGSSGRHAVPADEFDSLVAYITPIMQPGQAAAPAVATASAAAPAAAPAATTPAPAVAPAPPGFKNCNCNCQCPLNTPPGSIQNCTCSCACPPG